VIPAAVLLREIQARGYDGGYTRLKVCKRSVS
jgi:transposase